MAGKHPLDKQADANRRVNRYFAFWERHRIIGDLIKKLFWFSGGSLALIGLYKFAFQG